MAGTDSTSLRSLQFPQSYSGELIATLIQRSAEVLTRTREQIFLHRCDWTDEFCDCKEQGTVHDLKTEQEFCGRHFNLVEYRRGL